MAERAGAEAAEAAAAGAAEVGAVAVIEAAVAAAVAFAAAAAADSAGFNLRALDGAVAASFDETIEDAQLVALLEADPQTFSHTNESERAPDLRRSRP